MKSYYKINQNKEISVKHLVYINKTKNKLCQYLLLKLTTNKSSFVAIR